jgi:HSP20 family protein
MNAIVKSPFFNLFDVFDTSLVNDSPKTKVTKTEGEYKVIMSVPGLTKDDIKIVAKDGEIKISYEKTEKTENSLFVSSFVKSYILPDEVKESDIEGKVKDGVLELILPISKKKSTERLISLV